MFDFDVKSHFKAKPDIPDQSGYTRHCNFGFGWKSDYKTPTEVGIEIEIEKLTNVPTMYLWRLDTDGSLKDNGRELISYPFKNENVEFAVREYTEIFLKPNTNSTFSHRCSMHVHINVCKLTVGQLYCLIATYIIFEDLFFSLVREDRKGNSYCWPLADAMINRRNITPQNLDNHFKYAALNPHHLKDYGTLEFRHHGGSKDKKEILNWIETILQLYSFVENRNPNDVTLLIKNLNTVSNYEAFAELVFESKFAQFAHLPLQKMMRDNVTAAKLFLE